MSVGEQVKLIHGIVVGVFISAILFNFYGYVEGDRVQRQAIERGYALHCPKDGEFAWKGECDG